MRYLPQNNAQVISSLEFDGINDQIQDTGIFGLRSLPIQADQPISFSVWIKANSPATGMAICSRLSTVTLDGFSWTINVGGSVDFVLRADATSFVSLRSNVTVVEDVWEFWTVTYNGNDTDGDDIKMYRNGLDVSGVPSSSFFTPIGTIDYGTLRFRIGAINKSGGSGQDLFFDGNMKNFMQYTYVLDPSDVKVLFGGGSVQGPMVTGFPTSDQGTGRYSRNLGQNVPCTTIGGNWFGNRFLTNPFWGGSGFDFTPTVILMSGFGSIGVGGLSQDGPPV